MIKSWTRKFVLFFISFVEYDQKIHFDDFLKFWPKFNYLVL